MTLVLYIRLISAVWRGNSLSKSSSGKVISHIDIVSMDTTCIRVKAGNVCQGRNFLQIIVFDANRNVVAK